MKVCEDLRRRCSFSLGHERASAEDFMTKCIKDFPAAFELKVGAPETRLDIKCTGLIVDELHLCWALVMWKGVAVICTRHILCGEGERWMDGSKGLVQTRGVDWILTCVL